MSGGSRGYYSIGLFRSSLVAFAAGRVASALAGFALFLLLARTLPIADYGQYLTLLATLELVLLCAALVIPWMGILVLPEFVIRATPGTRPGKGPRRSSATSSPTCTRRWPAPPPSPP